MATQPRTDANGQTFEYGPTYKQLHAINHGKPIVAVTIANGDYHTPPNLMRLAMAEAAAHSSSYLSWPTWPEKERPRMIAVVRPQADFLRRNEELLNDAPFRADVLLFLPFRRWVDTENCTASALAARLTKENIQYKIICEDDFASIAQQKKRSVLLLDAISGLTPAEQQTVAAVEKDGTAIIAADKPNWFERVRAAIGKPSIGVDAASTVRAVVHDQPGRTIVHLYNLDVERLSSFEDKVTPAKDVAFALTAPFKVRAVTLYTADAGAGAVPTPLKFKSGPPTDGSLIQVQVPQLHISAIVVIDQ
jgi:hypothetical protein